MPSFGPRYPSRRRDALRGAQLAPVRSATGPHAIKTVHSALRVRAQCACGWKAPQSRTDARVALADGARHIGQTTRETR